MTISLASLFSVETYEAILQKGLDIAEAVGLPVSSWRAGDPTRAQYHYVAEVLSTLEPSVQAIVAAGFLNSAEGDALTLLAEQLYGVERVEATFAAGDLVLENTGGGLYNIAIGDLTFRSSVTSKTYRNTTAGVLASGPGTTLEISWSADEAGTLSSVGADEIDEMVTVLLGVEVQSSEAGEGLNEESDASLRQRCLDSLGALSPNGPADAYRYVASNPDLTGVTNVSRVEVVTEELGEYAFTGRVDVYLASPTGTVDGGTVSAVSDAIAEWATPLTVTPTVQSATALPLSVEATAYVRSSLGKTEEQVQAEGETAFDDLLAEVPIGGYDGSFDHSLVSGRVIAATGAHRVVFSSPSAAWELAVASNRVVTKGLFTLNVEFTDG